MTTAIFDADSHVMETSEWLLGYADPGIRELLQPLSFDAAGTAGAELMASLPGLWASHRHQDIGPEVIAGPKGWSAPGALDTEVRTKVLDALAIDAQLVFPTFAVEQYARSKNHDIQYGGAQALNRAMVDFCAPDLRLKAVGQVPLLDPARALDTLVQAIEAGVAAVWVFSDAPGDFSPTHLDLHPFWGTLADADIPFVLHVGGGRLLSRPFHNNGLARPKDWLGGGENLRSKDFPVLHHSPERFLACMALDGIFERFPTLRGAAIELGASWVPALLRNLDHAHRSFSKFEPVLKDLPLLPSEYVRRQVRFTPFPFEDTVWLLEQCGPELFMFSTDYPHPEGGKHPFEIFTEALSHFDQMAQERFFWGNGAELLGLA
ncbi:MAG TPA: amidohydrolase family protein [Acidimicrobiales bacterium]|jgi:predicted TIM-barrel fold metal-dependent hydrolase